MLSNLIDIIKIRDCSQLRVSVAGNKLKLVSHYVSVKISILRSLLFKFFIKT